MPDFTVRILEFGKKQWIIDETKVRELMDWLNENGVQEYAISRTDNFFMNLLRVFLRRN